MKTILRICLAVALAGLAATQENFQLLGNTVVDENFFVIGELAPGETLQQFIRRYRRLNAPVGGAPGPTVPRAPAVASSPEPLGLSSGATNVLGRIDESFSCEGLPYGFYADPENDCRIFHVCNPLSRGSTLQYSFFCNEGLEFDQQLLTCVRSFGRMSCATARQLYESSNSQFFKNVNFNEGVPLLSTPGVNIPPLDDGVIEIGVIGGVPLDLLQRGGSNGGQSSSAPDEAAGAPLEQGGVQVPGVTSSNGNGFSEGIGQLDLRLSLPPL
ncbi:uncharacterized protein LOC119112868 [Pollicipes pollicipes]|uniref:uncharacterized protein LOC119112868 n=1 Tax=Pollicipes pollicipes TaxID=41117 RepID=UPI001884CE2F|nr:uncharacterized protein LOC119112868 [Pollicipes pollicipes]